ncbi:MAG: hypothetical protein GWP74_16875 [Proteobacteria bacterium]|nr:hypothetical protein [Pseudomonadota bacterium]
MGQRAIRRIKDGIMIPYNDVLAGQPSEFQVVEDYQYVAPGAEPVKKTRKRRAKKAAPVAAPAPGGMVVGDDPDAVVNTLTEAQRELAGDGDTGYALGTE